MFKALVKKSILTTLLALFAASAAAQTPVKQSGTSITPGTVPYWVSNGIIGSGTSSDDSALSSLGVTKDGNAGFCVSSGRKNAAGRNQLCFGVNLSSAATISLQNYGTASAQAIQFVINGTTYAFPGSFSSLSVGSTPFIGGSTNGILYQDASALLAEVTAVNNAVLVTNGSGLPSESTTLPSGLTIPAPTFSSTMTATGLSSGTCASGLALNSSNGIVLAACPGSAASIQVGGTSVTSGASGNVEYNNAGVLGEATPGNGVEISGGTLGLTAARRTLPTVQTFTSGSGTYTRPANVLWIEVYLIGGGGGGSGGGSSGVAAGTVGTNTCWNTSGAACSTPVYQAGGGTGGNWATGAGGPGGTVSGSGTCTNSFTGQAGSPITPPNATQGTPGGPGGISTYGGGGGNGAGADANGATGAANSGGGGQGGGGAASSSVNAGAGGGGGASCYAVITSPASTYTYVVGATASGGAAGTSGATGGAGAAGKIWVVEHYGT